MNRSSIIIMILIGLSAENAHASQLAIDCSPAKLPAEARVLFESTVKDAYSMFESLYSTNTKPEASIDPAKMQSDKIEFEKYVSACIKRSVRRKLGDRCLETKLSDARPANCQYPDIQREYSEVNKQANALRAELSKELVNKSKVNRKLRAMIEMAAIQDALQQMSDEETAPKSDDNSQQLVQVPKSELTKQLQMAHDLDQDSPSTPAETP